MRIASLWRYPIKAVGREEVAQTVLKAGACMAWDRTWAVAHERAQIEVEAQGWARCANFIRAASSPALMSVTAALNEETEEVTLRAPERPEVTLHPERDSAALLEWLGPLIADGRPAPSFVYRAEERGLTDSSSAGVTIGNLASHRAVEQRVGRPLSLHRWRANIWLDGLAPWEEFDWRDREIVLGGARLAIIGRTERCRATEANPDTGRRDTDTLGALKSWGHQDFTVKAVVTESGPVAPTDKAILL